MSECWAREPTHRPRFRELADMLGDLLEAGEVCGPHGIWGSRKAQRILSRGFFWGLILLGPIGPFDRWLVHKNVWMFEPLHRGPEKLGSEGSSTKSLEGRYLRLAGGMFWLPFVLLSRVESCVHFIFIRRIPNWKLC